MPEWIKIKDNRLLISVHVKPGASRDEVSCIKQDCLTVKLSASPVEGRANESLVRVMASRLKVPPTSIRIVQGLKNRRKVIAVPGISIEHAQKALIPSP